MYGDQFGEFVSIFKAVKLRSIYYSSITVFHGISKLILLHEKFLQFDWLRAVVFQLNLKYLQVKITTLLWVLV